MRGVDVRLKTMLFHYLSPHICSLLIVILSLNDVNYTCVSYFVCVGLLWDIWILNKKKRITKEPREDQHQNVEKIKRKRAKVVVPCSTAIKQAVGKISEVGRPLHPLPKARGSVSFITALEIHLFLAPLLCFWEVMPVRTSPNPIRICFW